MLRSDATRPLGKAFGDTPNTVSRAIASPAGPAGNSALATISKIGLRQLKEVLKDTPTPLLAGHTYSRAGKRAAGKGDAPTTPARRTLGAGLLLLVLLAVGCRGALQQPAAAQAPPPVIEPLVPRRILPGDVLGLKGENFGVEPGQVTLGESALQVVSWSENRVLVRLPRDVAAGEATMTLKASAGSAQANVRIADPYFSPGIREVSCHNDFSYCSVYLPPAYDSEPDRRFPVVYHFQGSGWNNRLVAESADIARLAEPYGFILVFDFQIMADEAPLRLAREIDEAYRTLPRAEARGMWLTSASGRGLRIAAEHAGVFGAVDGSFACFSTFDAEKARHLRIRLDIGDLDATCGGATLRAHDQLAQAGIPHLYEVYPGGRHAPQSMFSDSTIRAVLDFFKSVFPGA